MRDYVFFFLNGQPVHVTGRAAFEMLAPFLRREHGLTGTKIACAFGACGSCTVLLGRPKVEGETFSYAPINSCLFPVWNCDGAHVITIEGVNGAEHAGLGAEEVALSPAQNAIVECHGTQCGFCTPGMVMTLTAWKDSSASQTSQDDDLRHEVTSALEGNLCRCTGYTYIIDAGVMLAATPAPSLETLYPSQPLQDALTARAAELLTLTVAADAIQDEQTLYAPRTFEEVVAWKAEHPDAVVVAGGTEVGVAISTKGLAPREILSLSRVEGLDTIEVENGQLILGAGASWVQVAEVVRDALPPFAQLLKRWSSPQLRGAGTVAGNIVRASPISDSLPLLLVCEAQLELVSRAGTRIVGIDEFLGDGSGPKLRPDELLRRVLVPLPSSAQELKLFKVAKRRAFDRSIVSAAFLLTRRDNAIADIRIAYGGVGPRALRLPRTEAGLQGRPPEAATWRDAAQSASSEVSPISDAGASREYRLRLVANLMRKFGAEI